MGIRMPTAERLSQHSLVLSELAKHLTEVQQDTAKHLQLYVEARGAPASTARDGATLDSNALRDVTSRLAAVEAAVSFAKTQHSDLRDAMHTCGKAGAAVGE